MPAFTLTVDLIHTAVFTNANIQSPRICRKIKTIHSLMATGRSDFLWRCPVHVGGISLDLKALLWLTTTSQSVWEPFAKMTSNLDSILLSDTPVRESSSTPTMPCDVDVLQMFWYSLFLCGNHTTRLPISSNNCSLPPNPTTVALSLSAVPV